MRTPENIINGLLHNQPPTTIFPVSSINTIIDSSHLYRPLHLAAMYSKNQSLFIYLFRHGASMTSLDRMNDTPITKAMRFGNSAFWEALHQVYQEEKKYSSQTEIKIESLESENITIRHQNTSLLTSHRTMEEQKKTLEEDNRLLRQQNSTLHLTVDNLEKQKTRLEESVTNISTSVRKKRKLEDR